MGELLWLPDPGADPAEGVWANMAPITSIRPRYLEQDFDQVVLALELKLTGQPLFTTRYGLYRDMAAAKNAWAVILSALTSGSG